MTTGLIGRIVLAVIIAVVVGLVLVGLLGPILITLHVPIATTVGGFFVDFGWAIGSGSICADARPLRDEAVR